jgi:hypothetical protein
LADGIPRLYAASDEINPVDLFMKAIEALLIMDPNENENTAGYSRGHSGDIDKREHLVTANASVYDFYIIF